ncbi:chemotaxis protein CheB [Polymorphobacter fuscus]|nr:chemotaxis protein CheB [Polymorphobacter fuscus]NJC07327.1 two-component system chemotaxis response regulator CheB [Polymorphobacter fuscus]
MSDGFAIIAIGASAGGVDALRTIVAALPADLNAAVFVVLHIGAHRSDLPWLLSRSGALPAAHGVDGEEVVAGRIYVAPPDHHMVIADGRVGLTKGPRENWARPAIDPLFRSAARSFGPNVAGVILTGGLNDGTAGLYEIKRRGGTAIVQDPADCLTPNMPQSAIANVDVDHIVPASAIGDLLTRLAGSIPSGSTSRQASDGQEEAMVAEFTHDLPVAVTCPDCGGALRRSELGRLTQFSCHIGHVYTAEVMLAAQFLAMERFVEQAMRSLSERAELCRQMVVQIGDDAERAAQREAWHAASQEAVEQSEPLRALITRPWIHPGLSRMDFRPQ